MSDFVPINWYDAGFKSPVEYFLYAANFNHYFDNIIVTNLIYDLLPDGSESEGSITIRGILTRHDHTMCSLVMVIDPHLEQKIIDPECQNEDCFAASYNGKQYTIATSISIHVVTVNPSDYTRQRSNDLLQRIFETIPEYFVKIGMIAISLEI